jgi:hypothetical protein
MRASHGARNLVFIDRENAWQPHLSPVAKTLPNRNAESRNWLNLHRRRPYSTACSRLITEPNSGQGTAPVLFAPNFRAPIASPFRFFLRLRAYLRHFADL